MLTGIFADFLGLTSRAERTVDKSLVKEMKELVGKDIFKEVSKAYSGNETKTAEALNKSMVDLYEKSARKHLGDDPSLLEITSPEELWSEIKTNYNVTNDDIVNNALTSFPMGERKGNYKKASVFNPSLAERASTSVFGETTHISLKDIGPTSSTTKSLNYLSKEEDASKMLGTPAVRFGNDGPGIEKLTTSRDAGYKGSKGSQQAHLYLDDAEFNTYKKEILAPIAQEAGADIDQLAYLNAHNTAGIVEKALDSGAVTNHTTYANGYARLNKANVYDKYKRNSIKALLIHENIGHGLEKFLDEDYILAFRKLPGMKNVEDAGDIRAVLSEAKFLIWQQAKATAGRSITPNELNEFISKLPENELESLIKKINHKGEGAKGMGTDIARELAKEPKPYKELLGKMLGTSALIGLGGVGANEVMSAKNGGVIQEFGTGGFVNYVKKLVSESDDAKHLVETASDVVKDSELGIYGGMALDMSQEMERGFSSGVSKNFSKDITKRLKRQAANPDADATDKVLAQLAESSVKFPEEFVELVSSAYRSLQDESGKIKQIKLDSPKLETKEVINKYLPKILRGESNFEEDAIAQIYKSSVGINLSSNDGDVRKLARKLFTISEYPRILKSKIIAGDEDIKSIITSLEKTGISAEDFLQGLRSGRYNIITDFKRNSNGSITRTKNSKRTFKNYWIVENTENGPVKIKEISGKQLHHKIPLSLNLSNLASIDNILEIGNNLAMNSIYGMLLLNKMNRNTRVMYGADPLTVYGEGYSFLSNADHLRAHNEYGFSSNELKRLRYLMLSGFFWDLNDASNFLLKFRPENNTQSYRSLVFNKTGGLIQKHGIGKEIQLSLFGSEKVASKVTKKSLKGKKLPKKIDSLELSFMDDLFAAPIEVKTTSELAEKSLKSSGKRFAQLTEDNQIRLFQEVEGLEPELIGILDLQPTYESQTAVIPKFVENVSKSGAKHVSRDLYDAAIYLTGKPLRSGGNLLTPEATERIWNYYWDKTLVGNYGKRGGGKTAAVFDLNQPSLKIIQLGKKIYFEEMPTANRKVTRAREEIDPLVAEWEEYYPNYIGNADDGSLIDLSTYGLDD